METKLIDIYNDLVDQGISIMDLYIYDCILNNSYGFEDESIEDTFYHIKDNYNNDYSCRSLDYHISAVLNGEEEDEWD